MTATATSASFAAFLPLKTEWTSLDAGADATGVGDGEDRGGGETEPHYELLKWNPFSRVPYQAAAEIEVVVEKVWAAFHGLHLQLSVPPPPEEAAREDWAQGLGKQLDEMFNLMLSAADKLGITVELLAAVNDLFPLHCPLLLWNMVRLLDVAVVLDTLKARAFAALPSLRRHPQPLQHATASAEASWEHAELAAVKEYHRRCSAQSGAYRVVLHLVQHMMHLLRSSSGGGGGGGGSLGTAVFAGPAAAAAAAAADAAAAAAGSGSRLMPLQVHTILRALPVALYLLCGPSDSGGTGSIAGQEAVGAGAGGTTGGPDELVKANQKLITRCLKVLRRRPVVPLFGELFVQPSAVLGAVPALAPMLARDAPKDSRVEALAALKPTHLASISQGYTAVLASSMAVGGLRAVSHRLTQLQDACAGLPSGTIPRDTSVGLGAFETVSAGLMLMSSWAAKLQEAHAWHLAVHKLAVRSTLTRTSSLGSSAFQAAPSQDGTDAASEVPPTPPTGGDAATGPTPSLASQTSGPGRTATGDTPGTAVPALAAAAAGEVWEAVAAAEKESMAQLLIALRGLGQQILQALSWLHPLLLHQATHQLLVFGEVTMQHMFKAGSQSQVKTLLTHLQRLTATASRPPPVPSGPASQRSLHLEPALDNGAQDGGPAATEQVQVVLDDLRSTAKPGGKPSKGLFRRLGRSLSSALRSSSPSTAVPGTGGTGSTPTSSRSSAGEWEARTPGIVGWAGPSRTAVEVMEHLVDVLEAEGEAAGRRSVMNPSDLSSTSLSELAAFRDLLSKIHPMLDLQRTLLDLMDAGSLGVLACSAGVAAVALAEEEHGEGAHDVEGLDVGEGFRSRRVLAMVQEGLPWQLTRAVLRAADAVPLAHSFLPLVLYADGVRQYRAHLFPDVASMVGPFAGASAQLLPGARQGLLPVLSQLEQAALQCCRVALGQLLDELAFAVFSWSKMDAARTLQCSFGQPPDASSGCPEWSDTAVEAGAKLGLLSLQQLLRQQPMLAPSTTVLVRDAISTRLSQLFQYNASLLVAQFQASPLTSIIELRHTVEVLRLAHSRCSEVLDMQLTWESLWEAADSAAEPHHWLAPKPAAGAVPDGMLGRKAGQRGVSRITRHFIKQVTSSGGPIYGCTFNSFSMRFVLLPQQNQTRTVDSALPPLHAPKQHHQQHQLQYQPPRRRWLSGARSTAAQNSGTAAAATSASPPPGLLSGNGCDGPGSIGHSWHGLGPPPCCNGAGTGLVLEERRSVLEMGPGPGLAAASGRGSTGWFWPWVEQNRGYIGALHIGSFLQLQGPRAAAELLSAVLDEAVGLLEMDVADHMAMLAVELREPLDSCWGMTATQGLQSVRQHLAGVSGNLDSWHPQMCSLADLGNCLALVLLLDTVLQEQNVVSFLQVAPYWGLRIHSGVGKDTDGDGDPGNGPGSTLGRRQLLVRCTDPAVSPMQHALAAADAADAAAARTGVAPLPVQLQWPEVARALDNFCSRASTSLSVLPPVLAKLKAALDAHATLSEQAGGPHPKIAPGTLPHCWAALLFTSSFKQVQGKEVDSYGDGAVVGGMALLIISNSWKQWRLLDPSRTILHTSRFNPGDISMVPGLHAFLEAVPAVLDLCDYWASVFIPAMQMADQAPAPAVEVQLPAIEPPGPQDAGRGRKGRLGAGGRGQVIAVLQDQPLPQDAARRSQVIPVLAVEAAGEAGGKEIQPPTYLISPAGLSDATTVISTPSTLRPRALAAFRQDDPTDSELSGTTGRSTGPPLRQGRDSSPAPSPTLDTFPSALEQVLPSSATDAVSTTVSPLRSASNRRDAAGRTPMQPPGSVDASERHFPAASSGSQPWQGREPVAAWADQVQRQLPFQEPGGMVWSTPVPSAPPLPGSGFTSRAESADNPFMSPDDVAVPYDSEATNRGSEGGTATRKAPPSIPPRLRP